MKTEDLWDTMSCRMVNTSGVSGEPAAYTIRVIQDERSFLRKEAADSSENLVAIYKCENIHLLKTWKLLQSLSNARVPTSASPDNEPGIVEKTGRPRHWTSIPDKGKGYFSPPKRPDRFREQPGFLLIC